MVVRVFNLVKYFGKRMVLKGISFDIEEGEVFGSSGPTALARPLR